MPDEDVGQGGLSEITDLASDFLGGVPAPVQKSFWKVAQRIVTGAAEIPAAWLEVKAENIRTQQKAKNIIVMKSAQEAAAYFKKSPDLALRALNYHASEIIQQQINREDVLRIAQEEIGQKKDIPLNDKTIEDDWLSIFLREASHVSSDDMKVIYGKILAGEISLPGSFSKRSIVTLATLDKETAGYFQILCKYAFDFRESGMNVLCEHYNTIDKSSPGQNSLSPIGLSFSALSDLENAGLIVGEFYGTSVSLEQVASSRVVFYYHGRPLWFSKVKDEDQAGTFNTVIFTKVGTELGRIIKEKVDMEHIKKLDSYLNKKGINLHVGMKKLEEGKIQGLKLSDSNIDVDRWDSWPD